MKPENWSTMSDAEKLDDAERLLHSVRGKLIIGQALARAVAVMRTEEWPEESNIQDMEELGEMLFAPFYSMHTPEAMAAMKKSFEDFKAKDKN